MSCSRHGGKRETEVPCCGLLHVLFFSGCLRAGEALAPEGMDFDPKAHLSFDDVSVDSLERPRVIRVRIKESKTDRFRKGATVALCWTGGCMCPVKAVLAFMVVRKAGPGLFFKLPAGKPLTRKSFVAEVRAALAKAGMACRDISGHSFRIGAATAAAQLGASEEEIKALGRWRSREYRGYVRTTVSAVGELPRKLATAAEPKITE